ncbi:hypothetical protein [Actinomadura sp. NPDC000600]|uniref:hypothetical protein n=1 Tax=Actinomadura sp. NPDC000600 TaxID=3154262 RepID=UPI00339895C7
MRRFTRRRFFSGVGATGLTTAAVIFGGAGTAHAAKYKYYCCNLCKAPSISMTTCRSYEGYLWSCSPPDNGYLHCTCCETINAGAYCPSSIKSAAECKYS